MRMGFRGGSFEPATTAGWDEWAKSQLAPESGMMMPRTSRPLNVVDDEDSRKAVPGPVMCISRVCSAVLNMGNVLSVGILNLRLPLEQVASPGVGE